jgi:hypothetical protein
MAILSNQLMAGARNCVQVCGGAKEGQHVLILCLAEDPLNPVEEEVVQALAFAAQEVGARPQVLWATGMEKGWWDDVSPVVLAAFEAADLVVNNTIAIGRPVKAVRQAMFGKGITMIRNMATTRDILAGPWARFPFRLSDEITRCVGERLEHASSYRIVHPNGTDVTGRLGRPSPTQSGFSRYNVHRGTTRNRPFPQGCHIPTTSLDAEGIIVSERTLPVEARELGVPEIRFSEPLRVTLERNHMVNFEGGPEAERFRAFFERTQHHIGSDAWNLSSFHSGLHPKARINETPEGNPEMWHRCEHNNPSVTHFHLGGSKLVADYDYPYMFHVSVEIEKATVYLDGEKLYDQGHLTVLDDPHVREFASQFGNPDELLREVPLYD